MSRWHFLGLALSVLIALPCVWHGQLSVNPEARLLFVPGDHP
jgi:hypothetical protein